MIDHVSIAVRDLARAEAFWERVLAPLGFKCLVRRERTVGFGKRYPEFWLNLRETLVAAPADTGAHICLRARDREAVNAFHAAALAQGGKSDGEPGERRGEMTPYYGAFVRDHDGNKVEAVTFPRPNAIPKSDATG